LINNHKTQVVSEVSGWGKFEQREYEHTGLHVPGHQFMGPKTDVANRIEHGHQPVDADDYVSRQHDIDYLAADNPIDIYLADIKAFSQYDGFTLHGLIGKLGMLTKMVTPLSSLFLQGHDLKRAKQLQNIIDNDRGQ